MRVSGKLNRTDEMRSPTRRRTSADTAKLPHIRFHDLRHSAGTDLYGEIFGVCVTDAVAFYGVRRVATNGPPM